MILTTLTLAAFTSAAAPQLLDRGIAFGIPLNYGVDANGVDWGPQFRQADHATVAINDQRDILVAFHSSRDDYNPDLKQVEIAYFQYNSASGNWSLLDRRLVGDVKYSPLAPLYAQIQVMCERPDVIAVGDRFFVVWTRIYDRAVDFPNQVNEPSVLECAWIQRVGTTVNVHNNSLGAGQGVILDGNYYSRECAGVPDAVVLDAPAGGPWKVGVVYPTQTDFGDIDPITSLPPGDNDRLCNLRLATCTIDVNNVISPPTVVTLRSGIPFDGDTAPLNMESAGLILPDCAPTSQPNQFWLAYEEQLNPGGPLPDGKIRLEYWELLSTGSWNLAASKTFSSGAGPVVRRRPNVSAFPQTGSGFEYVSLAFSKSVANNDGDVVYEQWKYSGSGLVREEWPLETGFENSTDDEIRPVPLHGRTSPFTRRCYVDFEDHAGGLCEIRMYNVVNDLTTTLQSSLDGLGRPAVAYQFHAPATSDFFALVWEQFAPGAAFMRVWLRVD